MTRREKELAGQLGECREALAQSRRENALLRQKIDLLVRRVFGSSSERLDRAQLELLLQLPESLANEEPIESSTSKITSRSSRKERTPRLPENLPVVEEVIDPEPVKAQPQSWRCIGQEVSEQLDFEPARFLRRRTVRRKYVHRVDPDPSPVIAPLPERLLDRSLPAPGLLAHILVGKYCDHLPLYRQEQIYAQRHGVHLPRQTLARWVELAADWLKPIYEHIRTGVMAGGYVQVDETPVDYLEPGNGKTRQGYLWTCNRPDGDGFYHWQSAYNDERLLSLLILVEQYQKGDVGVKNKVYQIYLNNRHRVNNWNLVDGSAPYIVGAHLLQGDRSLLYELAQSRSLWDRRIGILATLTFIRADDFTDTLKLTKQLLGDEHDLMHKACGWMLREVGKRNQSVLEGFLRQQHEAMPRTMLRYAIEGFPPAKRTAYLTGVLGENL